MGGCQQDALLSEMGEEAPATVLGHPCHAWWQNAGRRAVGGSRVAALSGNAPVSPGLLAGLVQMLPCGGCMGPCAAPVASRAWDAEPGM